MANNNPFMTPNNTMATNATPMPGTASNANMGFEIDLTEVSSGFTIPDGFYRIKCTDIQQSVSKSGNPMFTWDFEVASGENAGFQLKVFTAITPAAMWKVAETVQALGVGQTGQVVRFKRTDVVGKECGAYVEQSEYNGQMRSSIVRTMTIAEMQEAMNAN